MHSNEDPVQSKTKVKKQTKKPPEGHSQETDVGEEKGKKKSLYWLYDPHAFGWSGCLPMGRIWAGEEHKLL